MTFARRASRSLLLILALAGCSGCRRTETEYQKLVAENQYLKSEVERLNRRGADEKAPPQAGDTGGTAPDLDITLVDLWSQRFDDNNFRAKQRLSNKIIRLTGNVDAVAADAVALAGDSKTFGHVKIGISLTSGYAIRIKDGLAALERGTTVTVQGKFLYDRMNLTEALFVDQKTGRALYSDDLLALNGPSSKPALKPATPPPSTAPPPATTPPPAAKAPSAAKPAPPAAK